MTQKYAVLTVSGQSNAVGYDESPVYEVGGYAPHPRLKQLGLYDEHNLTIIPLTYSPEDVQDMRAFSHPATPDKLGTKGIHLPLGHLLLEQLPADYQLLVIPVAYGGTYFGSEEHGLGTYDSEQMRDVRHSPKLRWSVQSSYYKMLRDRLEYALNLHPDNVYLGNIWIQGRVMPPIIQCRLNGKGSRSWWMILCSILTSISRNALGQPLIAMCGSMWSRLITGRSSTVIKKFWLIIVSCSRRPMWQFQLRPIRISSLEPVQLRTP